MRRAGVLPALALACAPLAAHASEGAAAGPAGSIWTAASRQRMAREALKVAPPALARLVQLHQEAFLEGLQRGAEFEGQSHHRQDGAPGTAGAATALATVGLRAVEALDGHRPMREVVYYLGITAHFASDLADPVLADPGGREAAFTSDYSRYIESNVEKFPVVFYGYPRLSGAPGAAPSSVVEALGRDGQDAALAARRYFPHLSRAYAGSGGVSSGFDVRSIPFGVASLCYSRGVTSIARAWLHIWSSARGDLSGTPFLERPGRPPEAARESAGPGGPASPGEPGHASKD